MRYVILAVPALLVLLAPRGDCLEEGPVCIPASWEGLIIGRVASSNSKTGAGSLYDVTQQYSYDAPNNRSYAYQVLHNAASPIEDLVMVVYERPNEGSRYVVLPKFGTCSKEPSQFAWNPRCLPEPVKYLGRFIQAGLPVDFYQTQVAQGAIDVTMSLAADTNIPMMSMVTSSFNGEESLGGYAIANVTVGIKDPSIFTLPTSCNAVASAPMQPAKALADYF